MPVTHPQLYPCPANSQLHAKRDPSRPPVQLSTSPTYEARPILGEVPGTVEIDGL